MENGQEEAKTNDATDAVSEPASEDATEKSTEEATEKSSEEPAKELTAEEKEELMKKIRDQVEFYFGDVNLSRDKFLQEQIKLDDNWIPLTVMLKFKRLASLSKDADFIVKALESSEQIEISEDKKKIRRVGAIPQFTDEWRQEQEARTVYIKGFPLTDMTIDKFKEFLSPYEPHENIVIRKYSDKSKKLHFKGSIFVQFKTLEDAKAFMERESVKYGETELIKKWATDYAQEKQKEKETWKKKKMNNKAGKQKKTDEEGEEKEEGGDNEEQEEEEEEDNGLRNGTVFHFKDVPQTCTREKIKDYLTEAGANIAYIDFKKGQQEGYVRLREKDSVKPFLEKMKDKALVVDDVTLPVRIIEGEEEEQYLAKVKKDMKSAKGKHLKKSKHQSKKGRNAQRNARKRRSSPANDAPAVKKAAQT